MADLGKAIAWCNEWENEVGCIVLTGAGRAFAAGGVRSEEGMFGGLVIR